MRKKCALRFIWLLIFIKICPLLGVAETIKFEEILDKAIVNSYDLKIANIDIELSKYAGKELRSLYFPTLNAKFNTEYLKDLTGGISGVTAIGERVLTDNTMFQDSVSVNLSYNLLGIRRRKCFLAKKEVEQRELIYQKNLKDLKLRILEIYTETLLTYKELKAKKEILSVEQEVFRLKERLFKAGVISKIEVAEQSIRLVRVMEEIEGLKIRLKMLLEDIAFYTQQHYDSELIEPLNFKGEETEIHADLDEKVSVECQIYEKEIEKKKAELGLLRRERFPQVGLYSNYTFYGSNRTDVKEALEDLEPRNWSVGVVVTIPLFAGFKTIVRGKEIKMEIERLQLERDKKIAELKSLYTKTSKEVLAYKQELETKKELLKNVQNKTAMIERLKNQQITDEVVALNQEIELINQRLELEKTSVSKIAAIKKLNILRGSGGKKIKTLESQTPDTVE